MMGIISNLPCQRAPIAGIPFSQKDLGIPGWISTNRIVRPVSLIIQKASQGPSHETNFFFNVLRNIFSISEFGMRISEFNSTFHNHSIGEDDDAMSIPDGG